MREAYIVTVSLIPSQERAAGMLRDLAARMALNAERLRANVGSMR